MDHQDPTRSISEKGKDSDVLNRLESYGKLNLQYNRYASLLENAVQMRKSVREHIYEKVKKEYEIKVAALEQDRKNLEDLLQENLCTFIEERERLSGTSQEETDRLEEIDFRIRVGEFSEEEWNEERDTLNQGLLKHTEDLARIEEILREYTQAGFSGISGNSFEPPEANTQEPSPEPERSAFDVDPDSVVYAPDLSVPAVKEEGEEDEKDFPSMKAEKASEEVSANFLVMEEEPHPSDASCPVIHCPDTLSQEASQPETGFEQAASNGYVTGYLVAMEGSRIGDRFPMISSNITLGNSPGIDIRLEDSGISSFHARILYKDRKHYLENLDPMGRSFVNGIQADIIELKDGDVIRLGETKFQVEYASTDSKETAN